MSYAMITITTKPADTVWFNIAQPAVSRRAGEWSRTQPGYITSSVQRIAPNTLQNIIIFDTQANLDAFAAGLASNPDHLAREAYKATHGQVSTVTVR